jgi:hypothetical protein
VTRIRTLAVAGLQAPLPSDEQLLNELKDVLPGDPLWHTKQAVTAALDPELSTHYYITL